MKRFACIILLLLGITALVVRGEKWGVRDYRSPDLFAVLPPLNSQSLPQDTVPTARWRIQPTVPMEVADLDSSALDLKMPENVKQVVEYDDSTGVYYIGSKIGDSFLNETNLAP